MSGNPIGNSGIKFIAENSNWKDLHTLILHDIQIDDLGAKVLAANESWTKLEELDLSQNPLLGNLGAMQLSYNRAWIHIKRLLLYDCKVGVMGVKYLQRNSLLRFCSINYLIDKEKKIGSQELELSQEVEKISLRRSRKDSLALVMQPRGSNRRSFEMLDHSDNEVGQNID